MTPAESLHLFKRLLEKMSDPELKLDQLVEDLQAFPDLAHRLILNSNSVQAGGIQPICDLRHAIVYLGLRRVEFSIRQEMAAISEKLTRTRAA